MVLLHEFAPATIAELGSTGGGIDEIGEQDVASTRSRAISEAPSPADALRKLSSSVKSASWSPRLGAKSTPGSSTSRAAGMCSAR
jgi:hypothetical protein